jgi:hypothetical protein
MAYLYITAIAFNRDVKGDQFAVWSIDSDDKFMLPVMNMGKVENVEATRKNVHDVIDRLLDCYSDDVEKEKEYGI